MNTTDVTLTDESYDVIVVSLRRRLRDVREDLDYAIEVGANTDGLRRDRDSIKAALLEMGIEQTGSLGWRNG